MRNRPAPKRHHAVPEMLQKRFVDGEGCLHAFDRRRADGAVFRTRPANLFVHGHLYRRTEADGATDTVAEAWFSDLESATDPIIEKIVTAARQGRKPALTPVEFETWLMFFFMQWKRVPDLHLTTVTDAEVEETFDELIAELRQKHPHRAAEIDKVNTPQNRRRMAQNARVDALLRGGDEPLTLLRLRGLGVAKVTARGKSFVVSSRPVVKLTHPGRTHLLDPSCEMWLAVAPDVIVGLGPGPGEEKLVGIGDPAVIRDYNEACVNQSTVFASASAPLVRSLAKPR
ncbi:DUF4238 domain-containing protein [Phenylobacterium sp.]|uniref:DUF4238 domain-containing protein n=1 Tax=Phenylobacterium sp. TaxID=1871053 RepID=UPI0025EFA57A|nr:DUF4238 domain-containing protein [Phenylobacterium sp.]